MRNEQLRLGLWQVVNDRYPGSMITKSDAVPLARMEKPLSEARLTFISSSGVQAKGTLPFDVAHPVGDYTFRRVPTTSRAEDLVIHQLKYPTDGAMRDLNVVYPITRLQEMAADGTIGGLTENFYSFIGYNMDPGLFEATVAEDIAAAVEEEAADIALASPA
jgi:D-proline reductase (dithiol) PrdB